VALEISDLWQVAPGTFKYPGAAIIGHKRESVAGLDTHPIKGSVASRTGLQDVDFTRRNLGTRRSAWLLENKGMPAVTAGASEMPPQGADLMPRTAVCVDVIKQGGPEWQVDTPRAASPWAFTVKAAKELKDARFAGHVAPRFIHQMAQSENLLPFVLGNHCAPIAIPAVRTTAGGWKLMDDADIRREGFTETARRFAAINKRLASVGKGKTLQQRVGERGKLTKQVIGADGYLVLSGAGGKYICATCIASKDALKLAIDQTLYWQVFADEDAAWYCVGMLNSHALTEAIGPFNPKGDFGERHVHTLPYKMMPLFDKANDDHIRIATLAHEIADAARGMIDGDSYLSDPSRALTARRRKLRQLIASLPQFREMELLCAAALGTTAFGAEDEARDLSPANSSKNG
jgi:hypothetical protein